MKDPLVWMEARIVKLRKAYDEAMKMTGDPYYLERVQRRGHKLSAYKEIYRYLLDHETVALQNRLKEIEGK